MGPERLTEEQAQRIREWAAAYRAWNEEELARRRARAAAETPADKIESFLDLCETIRLIAPAKSEALFAAQLEAHLVERERVREFEERRQRAKSIA